MKYTNHKNEYSNYIRKIQQIPLLEDDEEYILAKEWRENQDQKSMDKLVKSHLKLVAKVASGYRGYGLDIEELISEGSIGIMQAMKHYDPSKGFRLSTYAIWWIKASINNYILSSWSLVKMGTTIAQKKIFFGMGRIVKKLMNDKNKIALEDEDVEFIAEKLSVPKKDVVEMQQRLAYRDKYLNSQIGGGSNPDSKEWIEWVADDSDNQEIIICNQNEIEKRKELFNKAMECLSKREHIIFAERRLSEPPNTLEKVSEKLGISRERVRQLEHQAFIKLTKEIKKIAKPDIFG
jgi:RNA polymerase sigma-32 factor